MRRPDGNHLIRIGTRNGAGGHAGTAEDLPARNVIARFRDNAYRIVRPNVLHVGARCLRMRWFSRAPRTRVPVPDRRRLTESRIGRATLVRLHLQSLAGRR